MLAATRSASPTEERCTTQRPSSRSRTGSPSRWATECAGNASRLPGLSFLPVSFSWRALVLGLTPFSAVASPVRPLREGLGIGPLNQSRRQLCLSKIMGAALRGLALPSQ